MVVDLNIFALGLMTAMGVLILSILVGGFFVWIGAKLSGIEKATFGRAIVASLAASVASFLFSWILALLNLHGFWSLLGILIGLLIVLGIFKAVFDTTWGKAFLIWLLMIVAMVIVVFVADVIFAAALVV